MTLLIRGGRLVDPSQGLDGDYDVLIEDGVVKAVERGIEAPEGVEVLDAAGRVVTPGLIDIHVHLREPGQEYKETIETGTRAAAAGGFTAVACMPNTVPVNDNVSVTEHIISEAAVHGYARVHPIAAVSRGLEGASLSEVGPQVEAGAVAISDDGRPVTHSGLMRRALEHVQHYGIAVVQHAEDLSLAGDGVMHEGEYSALLGVAGIPGASDDAMIARDLLLVEDTGGRYHVAHLSTARSVELLRQAKERGLPVTSEVSAHHLLLTDKTVFDSGLDPNTKMHPPLRSESDRQGLVEGIVDGTIDAIASDHAPHHPDEKRLDFIDAPRGIVGLETTVSLCLDRLVRPGIVTLSQLIDLLSCRPAKVHRLPGGSLAPGCVADVTLLDLDAQVTVAPSQFHSLGRNTPFADWQLVGAPVLTVLRGRVVELAGRSAVLERAGG